MPESTAMEEIEERSAAEAFSINKGGRTTW
jgi:hypothetical protein